LLDDRFEEISMLILRIAEMIDCFGSITSVVASMTFVFDFCSSFGHFYSAKVRIRDDVEQWSTHLLVRDEVYECRRTRTAGASDHESRCCSALQMDWKQFRCVEIWDSIREYD
jgi:hypothetical protein